MLLYFKNLIELIFLISIFLPFSFSSVTRHCHNNNSKVYIVQSGWKWRRGDFPLLYLVPFSWNLGICRHWLFHFFKVSLHCFFLSLNRVYSQSQSLDGRLCHLPLWITAFSFSFLFAVVRLETEPVVANGRLPLGGVCCASAGGVSCNL